MSTLDEIAKLKSLLDDGALTQEEYDTQKAKLLAEGDGPAQQSGPQQQWQPSGGAQYRPAHVPGTPYASREEDVEANKIFGVLSYISFLCIISIFAAPKESHYARFHANQGLVLFIVEIIGTIALNIASAATGVAGVTIGALFAFGSDFFALGPGFFGPFIVIKFILWAFGICTFILAVLGIVNAVNGNDKPLPVIGGIRILK